MAIKVNCFNHRCSVNGEINMGDCTCEFELKNMNNMQIIEALDTGLLQLKTIDQVSEVVARINQLRGTNEQKKQET